MLNEREAMGYLDASKALDELRVLLEHIPLSGMAMSFALERLATIGAVIDCRRLKAGLTVRGHPELMRAA